MKKKPFYPRIDQLGIKINTTYEGVPPGILESDLTVALNKHGLNREKFGELFGVQTMASNGMYPWDVEAVLERMISGTLTGTQYYWD